MEFLSDPVLLARLQFAATAAYHFIFVPLTIGLGLIMAINATRSFRSRAPEDEAATVFWVKIFTATFVLGVATGITMEFSFGTNWADYSRFVGDIFGAPLAAEALLAFFLESSFLGVLLFGRGKVSPKLYCASAWLVWFGSALSALWILIANSWMQTPAGAELSADGTSAVLTDFLAAALNPSLVPRYGHTVLALLVMGAFVAMAVAGWYMLKGRHAQFAAKTMRLGVVVAIVSTAVLLGTAHSSAVVVSEEQPSKLAMMEGMYDSEVPPLYAFGWVDEQSQEVVTPFSIPGGTSFLATGTWDTEFPGLNELAQTEQFAGLDPATAPVNFVFQTYHLMVAMFGAICLICLLALIFTFRKGKIVKMRWLQWLCVISPVFPFIAIQAGWFTAEVGRQPWVVYPSMTSPDGVSLLVQDGVSASVSNVEVAITLILFLAVYLFLLIAWARTIGRFIKEGPAIKGAPEAGAVAVEEVLVVDKGAAAAPVADASRKGGE
ncbi:cytochrome ubiquinol oxidase subunit I [Adlercreutzia aquisgranensis]|uniref:cytochrome ubiquinol oxidase subunit I n=1 Tax=Adlercreutzia aquisgranensis TaxID=2941323 RepID=UPI002040EA76|nr:cytochrome ubiquinol oxidase subunit I [Adlercreutzia aquisgranensis]